MFQILKKIKPGNPCWFHTFFIFTPKFGGLENSQRDWKISRPSAVKSARRCRFGVARNCAVFTVLASKAKTGTIEGPSLHQEIPGEAKTAISACGLCCGGTSGKASQLSFLRKTAADDMVAQGEAVEGHMAGQRSRKRCWQDEEPGKATKEGDGCQQRNQLRQRSVVGWRCVAFIIGLILCKGVTGGEVRDLDEDGEGLDGIFAECPGRGQEVDYWFGGQREEAGTFPRHQEGPVDAQQAQESICEAHQIEGGPREEACSIQGVQDDYARAATEGDQEVRRGCAGAPRKYCHGGDAPGPDREGTRYGRGTFEPGSGRDRSYAACEGLGRREERKGAEEETQRCTRTTPAVSDRRLAAERNGPKLCGTDGDHAEPHPTIDYADSWWYTSQCSHGEPQRFWQHSGFTPNPKHGTNQRPDGAFWSSSQDKGARWAIFRQPRKCGCERIEGWQGGDNYPNRCQGERDGLTLQECQKQGIVEADMKNSHDNRRHGWFVAIHCTFLVESQGSGSSCFVNPDVWCTIREVILYDHGLVEYQFWPFETRLQRPWKNSKASFEKKEQGCTLVDDFSSGLKVTLEADTKTNMDMNDRETNVEGCTSYEGTKRQLRFANGGRKEQGCTWIWDYGGKVEANHSYRLHCMTNFQRAVEGDLHRWIAILYIGLHIGSWGMTYILVLRGFAAFFARMFFLQYERSQTATGIELLWQYVRLIFWASSTLGSLLALSKRRRRRLQIVSGRRHCTHGRTPRNGPSIFGITMAVLILQGHAIDVLQKCEAEGEPAGIYMQDDVDANKMEDEETCLQQKPAFHQAIPQIKYRYDPDQFDPEQDTILDEVVYPIPQTIEEALDQPGRHLWGNYHEAWPVIATVRANFGGQSRLDTYGLRRIYLSNRIVEVRDDEPQDVLRAIATVWADYSVLAHMHVHYVTPQPPNNPPSTITLIVEFPTSEDDHVRVRPVLVDTIENGRYIDRRAGYLDRASPTAEVAELCQVRGRCVPYGVDDCTIFARNQLYSMYEDIIADYGDYITLHIVTFLRRFADVLPHFPAARELATDFLWRSEHYTQSLFTLFIYGIYGQQRLAPITIERDLNNFRAVDTLWQEVYQRWLPFGANARSILHMVRPQNIFHGERYAIHMIMDLIPNFPMVPVLVTIVVQSGGQRPDRVETRAWQLPPRITLLHFMTLIGYASFSREYAVDAFLTNAGHTYRGGDTDLWLQNGGNYELRLLLPSISDFVSAVAASTHQLDTVPAEDSESESQVAPTDDDMDLMQRSLIVRATTAMQAKAHAIPLHPRMWSHEHGGQTYRCFAARYEEKNLITTSYIETRVYPLPDQQGFPPPGMRVLRLFPSWRELCSLLISRGLYANNPIKFMVYGLREVDMGRRLVRSPAANREVVLQAIQNAWLDVIQGASFHIFLIDPQPLELPVDSIGLLLEVPVQAVNVDNFAPILFDAHLYTAGAPDHDQITRTDYAPRRATSESIYRLAPAQDHCAPRGIHHCQIQHKRQIYARSDDAFQIPSGSYIVLTIQPAAWHFRDCSSYFHGAAGFAQEAHELFRDPEDMNIIVTTHAVHGADRPLGERSLYIHHDILTEPNVIWNLVANLWCDVFDTTLMRIIFAPTPPQLEDLAHLNLIVLAQSQPACLPVLISYYLPANPPSDPPLLQGTYALQLSVPTSFEVFRAIAPPPYPERLSSSTGSIWCEDRYLQLHEAITPEAGTHILVYAEHPSTYSVEEGQEEEEVTEDEIATENSEESGTKRGQSIQGVSVGLVTSFLLGPFRSSPVLLLLLWSLATMIQDDGWGISRSLPRDHDYTMFDRLPPPGNGTTTVLDFTRDLETLDDYISYEWGTCLFDCAKHMKVKEQPKFTIAMPEMSGTMEYLMSLTHEEYPRNYLCDHLDEFEEDIREPIALLSHGPPTEELRELQIYTDGSYGWDMKGTNATGWAFIAFGCMSGTATVLHMATGRLVTDPQELNWTGATEGGSRQGEIEALIRAVLWLIASLRVSLTPRCSSILIRRQRGLLGLETGKSMHMTSSYVAYELWYRRFSTFW